MQNCFDHCNIIYVVKLLKFILFRAKENNAITLRYNKYIDHTRARFYHRQANCENNNSIIKHPARLLNYTHTHSVFQNVKKYSQRINLYFESNHSTTFSINTHIEAQVFRKYFSIAQARVEKQNISQWIPIRLTNKFVSTSQKCRLNVQSHKASILRFRRVHE